MTINKKSPAHLSVASRTVAVLAAVTLAGFGLAGCGKDDGGGGKTIKKGTQPETTNTNGTQKPATTSSGGYEEMASVADGGTVKGTITYGGDKTAPPLKVTKNPETCKGGGEPDGSLKVESGAVKNAIVYLTEVKKGKKWPSDSVTVDNVACAFEPRVAVGKLRGKVVAKNSDPLLHNTNLFLKENKKQLANIALPTQGQTQEKDLKRPGLVDVKCDVHEWMQGWLYVSEHPYAVVTSDDGTYTLDEVPAGEYTAKVWHETLGEKEMKVKVEAGQTATHDVAFN